MKLSQSDKQKILEILKKNPAEYGLPYPRWSYRNLSGYLETQGIHVNHSSLFQFLKKEGIDLKSAEKKPVVVEKYKKEEIVPSIKPIQVVPPKPAITVSDEVLDIVMEQKQKAVAITSPVSACVLRYLRKTVPEFSVSGEARRILETGLKEKYPDIWNRCETRLKK